MLEITLNGQVLRQDQINAIVPVINKYIKKAPHDRKDYEKECIKAMIAAGCPFNSISKTCPNCFIVYYGEDRGCPECGNPNYIEENHF